MKLHVECEVQTELDESRVKALIGLVLAKLEESHRLRLFNLRISRASERETGGPHLPQIKSDLVVNFTDR